MAHYLDLGGEMVSAREYCRRKNLSYRAVQYRVKKYGETYSQAIAYYETKEDKSTCTKYLVDYNGNLVSVSEYCRIRGISLSAVYNKRCKTGDSFENILAYYEENGNRTYRQQGIIKDRRFNAIWREMVDRCTNQNHKYFKKYSKLGIQESWLDFENFQDDMYEEYLACLDNPNDLPSIDRIDNNKGYFKENCHWIPRSKQNRNKDNNIWANEDELLIEYCERKGLRYDVIHGRIQNGHTLEEAESMPIPKYNGKYLEYVGKNIREFNVLKLNDIVPSQAIVECNICGTKMKVKLDIILKYKPNKGCSCRKGHKFYIGNNNYTYKELETLYNLSHEDMRKVIDSGDMSIFSNIVNLTNEEWIELLKDIHNKW